MWNSIPVVYQSSIKELLWAFLYNIKRIFFWLHHMACGILVPQPRIRPMPPAVKAQSLNHWTGRKIWGFLFFVLQAYTVSLGFPCGPAGRESTCDAGDLGLIPGLGRSPGEGNGYLLQDSGLENSVDCIVHGVTKSQTQLGDFHFHSVLIVIHCPHHHTFYWHSSFRPSSNSYLPCFSSNFSPNFLSWKIIIFFLF